MILIKSDDPYLLSRLGTEMGMLGMKHNMRYTDPFTTWGSIYIRIYDNLSWQYLNHPGIGENNVEINLTDDNYNQIAMQLESLKRNNKW